MFVVYLLHATVYSNRLYNYTLYNKCFLTLFKCDGFMMSFRLR